MKINFYLLGISFLNLTSVAQSTDKSKQIAQALALWYNNKNEQNKKKAIENLKLLPDYEKLEQNFKNLTTPEKSVLVQSILFLPMYCNSEEKQEIKSKIQKIAKLYTNLDKTNIHYGSLLERSMIRDVKKVINNRKAKKDSSKIPGIKTKPKK